VTHDDNAPLLCGTNAGYIRHMKSDGKPCEDCRAAHTLAQRLYRARAGNPGRIHNLARNRALSRLGRLHPDEFRALYREERALIDSGPLPGQLALFNDE
jgi:hypothetical protein